MSAGKGDAPRNIFSRQFRENFDGIEWGNVVSGPYEECLAAQRANSRAERREHKHAKARHPRRREG